MRVKLSEKSKDRILNGALILSLILATGVFVNSKNDKKPHVPVSGEYSARTVQPLGGKEIKIYEPLQSVETDIVANSGSASLSTVPATYKQTGNLGYQFQNQTQPQVQLGNQISNLQTGISIPPVSTVTQLLGLPSLGLL